MLYRGPAAAASRAVPPSPGRPEFAELVAPGGAPYFSAMRASVLLAAAALVAASVVPFGRAATPAHAPRPAPTHAGPPPNVPRLIGKYDDWQAAIHQEAGQTVCYALTRAATSAPKLPGRGDVVLTVTERPSGRDAVAISAGFVYPPNAEVAVQIERASQSFYTAQRSAFSRDGHATVEAFARAREAVAKSPSPHGMVTDNFSLRGFSAAYAAIVKACPAGAK